MHNRIILVEDNDSIREAVASYLKLEEFSVLEFSRLRGVLDAVRMQNPDLVILDVMLPDGNGFAFAKKLRLVSQVPIIFLTAKTAESDRITGFEVGGDDYVTKPFSPKELVLRVKSVLKRVSVMKQPNNIGKWRLEEMVLKIDRLAHRAFLNEKEVKLTPAEWKILRLLAENSGIVLERERILGESLDYIAEGSERTIDTHIKNIRIKLGSPEWIETVRGYGYRFSGIIQ
jgi:DNA-binding response OmpR family regulator